MRYIVLIVNLLWATLSVALPLNEAFNGTWPPSGWSAFQSGNGIQVWTRSPVSQPPWGFSGYSRKETVPVGQASRRWLVTPAMFPQGADSVLRFFTRTQTPALPADTTDDSLYVKLSFGGTSAASFTETLISLKPGIGGSFGASFVEYRLNLSAYAGNVVRVAFHSVDFDWADHNIYVDSVSGPLIPTIPGTPAVISPQHNSLDAPVQTQLVWTNGAWTSHVDVYLSSIQAEVTGQSPAALVYTGSAVSSLTPPLSFLGSTTYYWRVICRNALGQATGSVWSFTTGNGPLQGTYVVGPDGQFATVSAALSAISLVGISGPTQLRIAAGTYAERLTIPAITGASAAAELQISRADTTSSVIFEHGAAGDSCVALFDQAQHVSLDGLEFHMNSATLLNGILISSASQAVTVRNCRVHGFSPTVAASNGISINGSALADIHVENTTVTGVADGIDAISTDASGNIVVSGCTMDSVRRGIVLTTWAHAEIRGNNISVNAGSVEDVTGIHVGTTLPGDSVLIQGNRIHTLVTNGPFATGIRIRPDSALAVIDISNNFVYDFRTTGSSQARGIAVLAGRCRILNNSLEISDAIASGSSHSLYVGNTPAGSSVTLLNNILVNREATASAFNLFILNPLISLVSDYNIFYGTGVNYKLARRISDAVDLPAWQSLSGLDEASLFGDPGFGDFIDLHLSSTASGLAHQNGLYLPDLGVDIDGEARRIPPDRGADEFAYFAPAADYAVISLLGIAAQFEVSRTIELRAVILNRGSAPQFQVPLTVRYAGTPIETQLITLDSLQLDTVLFYWYTGDDTSSGILTASVMLAGDADGSNDSISLAAAVVSIPMAGIYRIGPSGDYPTITDAVSDAMTRGISAAVEFHVAAGAYEENVVLGEIPGASPAHTICFKPDPVAEGTVSIRSEVGPATIELNGTDHVLLHGLHIEAIGANTTTVLLQNGADDNVLEQCELSGSSVLATTTYGLRVLNGHNDRNLIRDCTISGAYRGVRLEGTSSAPDTGNVVSGCEVTGCRTGIRVDFQHSCVLSGCGIVAGYDSALVHCLGVHVSTLAAGQSVIVEGNRISSAAVMGNVHAINLAAANGQALIRNNMIFGLQARGAGSVSALHLLSGAADIDHNSILLSDNLSTGNRFGLVDSSGAVVRARNNIFAVAGSTTAVWCLIQDGGILESDYNLFADGTGGAPGFRVGRIGATNYATLPQWQAGAGQDAQSDTGSAGYVSATDLHVLSTAGAASNRGITLAPVTTDIDGDVRQATPDLGADEYLFISVSNDYAVLSAPELQTVYRSDSSYALAAVIANHGAAGQSDVPVTFLFDNNVLEQRFISLASLASDTVIFMWTAPVATLMDGELTIHSELSGDEIPANNECRITITIAGPALAGHYEIGGPVPDFTALSDAAMHLSYRGVAGPVDILVHAGDYVDAATFAPIPGTSAAAVVTIHGPDSLNRPVISYPAGEELLLVDGASFLEFAHLELYGPPESWAVVRIRAGSDGVRVSDCVIHGTDSTASYSYGISVDDGGCDANEILNCVIHGAFTGIGLNGSSGTSSGNRVQGCHVLNARYGISVLRQTAAVIDGNDIEAGFATNFVAPCYGIYVGNLGTGGSVTINGNVLHRFADHSGSTSNRAVGIYSAPSGAATATITNNFIFGFDDILNVKINGIYLSAGTNTVYHNSILLGNAPGVNEVACVYISTGSSHTLLNNILVSRATEVTSYGIQHASGDGLISDYNLIYGTSPVFVTGRLGATSYVNLAQWQGAAFDLQGMAAEPGFVSETDLHIRADSSVVDGQGVSIPGVLFDIDGESRSDPPDLGADEYDFAPIPNAVVDLRAIMSMDGLLLQWSPSPGVLSYRVYASANMDTIFAPENLIATVSTTSYVEPNPGAVSRAYYVVTADTAP